MPVDEEGNKWACEPCIRGHRSTTCQHWDRFMLRVNKPGRPLGKCPHTAKSCTCSRTQVMMVKIVHDSGCFCRPQKTLEESSSLQSHSPSTNLPPDISKRPDGGLPGNPNLLDDLKPKPESKEVIGASIESIRQPGNDGPSNSSSSAAHRGFGSCCSTRRQDVLPKPIAAAQPQILPAISNNHRSGAMKRALQHDDFIPPTSPMDLIEDGGILDYSVPLATGGHQLPANKRRRSSAESFGISNRQGGCCSSGSHTHQAIVQTAPRPSNPARDVGLLNKTQQTNGYQYPSELSMFSIPSESVQAHISYQPVNVALDASIGLPLASRPAISTIETNGFGAHHFDSSIDQLESQDIKYADFWGDQAIHNTLPDSDACRCGDDCECLACPVHPFNNTTRNEIQELATILQDDWAKQYAAQTLPTPNNELNAGISSSPEFMLGNTFYVEPSLPFTTAPVDHALQSSTLIVPEYNTIQFMYQQCEGQVPICQCQDDCSCPGCPTHEIPPLTEDYENPRVLQSNMLANVNNVVTNLQPDFPQAASDVPNGGQQHQYPYRFPLGSTYLTESQYTNVSPAQDQIFVPINVALKNSN